MPLRDFKCTSCDHVGEHFYHVAGDIPTCPQCGANLEVLPLALQPNDIRTVAFPFVNPHIDPKGRPIVVENMAHLRALERKYGVVLSAFSQNPNNLDPIKDPPRYRGWEMEQ